MSPSAGIDLAARPLRVAGAALLGVAALRPLVAADVGVPCPLRAATGVPCPFCGMTRGVTSVVHGDVVTAIQANPGSVLLVLAVIASLVAWRRPRVASPAWPLLALIGALWVFQLVKQGLGPL